MMTVVVLAAFNPQESSYFEVPDCVNAPGVKVTDCRLQINSNWEHRDLVNLGANFNNNIPVAASFCFDDMDVSEAWMCGDKPTQGFTAEIYGNREHALAVRASNAHVEGNEVPFVLYLGNLGNRVVVTGAETKIKPNGQLEGFSGEANQSTIRIAGTPYGITDLPCTFEAYLDQDSQFLLSD